MAAIDPEEWDTLREVWTLLNALHMATEVEQLDELVDEHLNSGDLRTRLFEILQRTRASDAAELTEG